MPKCESSKGRKRKVKDSFNSTDTREDLNHSDLSDFNSESRGKRTKTRSNKHINNNVQHNKELKVHLTNVFHDEVLCIKYDLFSKMKGVDSNNILNSNIYDSQLIDVQDFMPYPKRVCYSVTSSSPKEMSSDPDLSCSSINEPSGYLDDLELDYEYEESEEEKVFEDKRNIVLKDNIITISKTVSSNITNKTQSAGRRNFISSNNNANVVVKCVLPVSCNQAIHKQTKFSADLKDIMGVTSHDKLFEHVNMPAETDLILGEIRETAVELKTTNSAADANTSAKEFQRVASVKDNVFKFPLPPSKRPPSRTKSQCSSISTNSSLTFNPGGNIKTQEDKEDTLSIYTSSIDDGFSMCHENTTYKNDKVNNESRSLSNSGFVPETCTNKECPTDNVVEEWLEKVPSIGTTSQSSRSSTGPTSTKWIPQIFKRVCYRFMCYSRCTRGYCYFMHSFETVIPNLLNLTYDELQEAYNWALEHVTVFKGTFNAFTKRFSRLEKVPDLLNMIDDVLNIEVFDRTPFIQDIIRALQNRGFSFKGAVEEMIASYGCKNLTFSDILLNLITKNTNEPLEENWSLVQTLIEFRHTDIDHGVINDILHIAITSKSASFCKDICEDILIKSSSNHSCIDKELLRRFMQKLVHLNLHGYVYNLNKIHKVDGDLQVEDASPVHSSESVAAVQKIISPCISPVSTSHAPITKQNSFEDISDSEMSQSEILELSESLKSNLFEYIALLHRYKGTHKVNSFAVHTVATLQKVDRVDLAYMNMMKTLELDSPDFMRDRPLKSLVEQISYNIMDLLTFNDEWVPAGLILSKFVNTLDSFVRTREFKKTEREPRTLAGRYIYCCKILIKSNDCRRALAIFLRNDLQLLYAKKHWRIFGTDNDELYRNAVVNDLLYKALKFPDLEVATTLIYAAIEKKFDFRTDIWSWCSNLFCKMLDNFDKFQSKILQCFQENISKSWYRKLQRNILRALCIKLLPHIPRKDALDFFDKCTVLDVYRQYKGDEDEISVATDMTREEIYLALNLFFHKRNKLNACNGTVKINLVCPNIIYNEPQVLVNSDVGFKDMKLRISDTLVSAFQGFVDPSVCANTEAFIVLPKDTVSHILLSVKMQNI